MTAEPMVHLRVPLQPERQLISFVSGALANHLSSVHDGEPLALMEALMKTTQTSTLVDTEGNYPPATTPGNPSVAVVPEAARYAGSSNPERQPDASTVAKSGTDPYVLIKK